MDLFEVLGIDDADPFMRSAIDMQEQRSSLVREIASIRKANNLTQQAVADAMHISKQAVTQFEAGNRDIKLSTLIRYAMAVGAHIDLRVEPIEQRYRIEIERGTLNRPENSEGRSASLRGTYPLASPVTPTGWSVDTNRKSFRGSSSDQTYSGKVTVNG